ELRTLKYFISLAQRGSFTAAAADHYVTQPAISVQLRKLREEFGARLVEMEGRKIGLTPAGKIVLDYARRITALETELRRELKDLEGLKKGNLALGTIDTASIYVLPEVFSAFHDRYPGIEVNLEISSTMPLLSNLARGKLDLVVGTLPVEESENLQIFPFYREELVPIAPPAHPLVREGKISVGKLAGYPFISFQKESVTRRLIEDALRAKGVEIKISMAIDSQEAIRNLVASGLGLSFLPYWTVKEYVSNGTLALLSLRGFKIERRLGLMVPARRYLSTTVKAFLGVMREGLGIDFPDDLYINAGSHGRSTKEGDTDEK
ncbi:MAG: LysR family transcriptional regulator, partial [Candidatus Krumholzibacteriota bacterium]|nr:LysR family transcriptional regulator [Candidatus Krumholzibacteriota bacterium]